MWIKEEIEYGVKNLMMPDGASQDVSWRKISQC